MGFPFSKKKKEPIPHETHPWSGERANARQLEIMISEIKSPISHQDLLVMPPEASAILGGFNEMVKEVVRTRDRAGLMRAFAFAHAQARDRARNNYLAFMTVEQRREAHAEQRVLFERELKTQFGKEVTDINGEIGASTREGGLGWAVKQGFLVLLNPVDESIEIKQKAAGKETVVKKTVFHIKPGLFDDWVAVTWQGIIISNPDSGQDLYTIEWSDTNSLVFSTNATFLVDPINSYIMPLRKAWAHRQFVPFGTFTIKDRQSGKTLVTAVMMRPDEFKRKIEKLRSKMLPAAIPSKVDVKYMAPLEVEDFLRALPGSLHEEIRDLLVMDGRSAWRRFSHKVGINWKEKLTVADWQANPNISTLFVFQGKQYADEKAMAESIQNAMRNIVREVDPDTRRARMRALQEVARRMRPHVGKLMQNVIDRVLSVKVD
jgi:hypothetical protein